MKKALPIVISAVLLAVIYLKIDLLGVLRLFARCNLWWLALSLAITIPTVLLTSWRLRIMAPSGIRMRLGEAIGLTLSAGVLNLVLPSKMGDLAKAGFIKNKDHAFDLVALPLVIFEKSCDMLSLLAWCAVGLLFLQKTDALFWTLTAGILGTLVFGLLLLGSTRFAEFFFVAAIKVAPQKFKEKLARLHQSWNRMHGYFWQDKLRLAHITLISLVIWFLHLLQIWIAILALREYCPFVDSMGLTALAIFAGLLPFTFAGVGTRDAALIFFYRDYFSSEVAAALGFICTLRYILPALAGLPVFSRYLSGVAARGQTPTA